MRARFFDWLPRTHNPDAFDWSADFAEIFFAEDPSRRGFDIVLANPPYVRQELITEIKPALKATYDQFYTGTADLYVYFYYRGIQLLKQDGALSYISSDKWLRAGYGSKLRSLLAETTGVRTVVDFGDLPVFESATAYPMVIIASKGRTNDRTTYVRVPSLAAPYPDVDAVVERYGEPLPDGALSASTWALTGESDAARNRRVDSSGVPFIQYVGEKVYYGIKTGFGRAFVLTDAQRDKLIRDDPKSREIIEPFATGKEIKPWVLAPVRKWIILTKIGMDISRYPAIFRHLSQWEDELRRRDDQGNHWWELRPCTYYDAFFRPKIIYQAFQVRPCFSYDRQHTVVNNSTYIIPMDDLYLLGVMNSAPFWQEIVRHCSPIQNGYQLMRTYFGKCIVPTPRAADRVAIADLAQKCVDAKGQGPEVAEWEAEINARVAKLYGLS